MGRTALRDEEYEALLEHFPDVAFGFAYGSGVIEQSGYSYSTNQVHNETVATVPEERAAQTNSALPMLDVIFAVDDAEEWHQENRRMNPSHYTSILSSTRFVPSSMFSMQQFEDD